MSIKRQRELQVAIEAVRAASRICRSVQARAVRPQTIEKNDLSPVTVADFASQAVICAKLKSVFPRIPIVAEENPGELRKEQQAHVRRIVTDSVAAELGAGITDDAVLGWIGAGGAEPVGQPQFWALDPLDGTKGFLRGDSYAVALGLIENGVVVLGVLGCPCLPLGGSKGALVFAVRGQRTRILPLDSEDMVGTAVHVSHGSDPSAARFCESVEPGHSNQDRSARVAALLGITTTPIRMDSQAKYAAVARGEASIYLRLPTGTSYSERIWDHAAGSIVVEEAGGRVSDTMGRPLGFGQGRTLSGNHGVVATNGLIHDAVIEAIARSGEQRSS